MSRASWGGVLVQAGLIALVVPAFGRCTEYTTMAGDDAGTPGPGGGPQPDGGAVGEVGIAACEPAEAPPADALFVAPPVRLEDGEGNGTREKPFATVALALAAAEARGGAPIVLAAGVYAESLVLAVAVPYSLQGAWIAEGGAWRRDCSAGYVDRTQLVSSAATGLTVQNAARLGLRNLTVRTEASATQEPASRYGLFAVQTDVTLDNVRVSAPPAVRGANGTPGTPGAPTTCSVAAGCVATAVPGVAPAAATPASDSGTFEIGGYTPRAGTPATLPGSAGSPGTPGGQGASSSFCAAGATCGSSSCEALVGDVTGGAGQCGCGGGGGGPGSAGQGGGASVAVYVVGHGVQIVNSVLTSGAGGAGGTGGAGGAGSVGAPGAAGAPADCYQPMCCGCSPGDQCYSGANWNACCRTAAPTVVAVAGGTPGGAGATGGAGQRGGAGAGGPSYALVLFGNARKIQTASQYVFGQGGAGPDGARAGAAGAELVVP